jgi:hypothetical protein
MEQTADRVRANTASEINRRLDDEARLRVEAYAHRSEDDIARRIAELDREWDTERILEMNASALALAGLMLGITRDRKWFLLPSVVLPFLFQHAVQGWCPPLPILRRWGVRSRKEIDREKYALKVLRGDFRDVAAGATSGSAAMEAVRK